MDAHSWVDLAGFVGSALVSVVVLIWRLGRIEFKLDLMWRDYAKRYGLNGHSKRAEAHGD